VAEEIQEQKMEETKVYLPCGHSAEYYIPEDKQSRYADDCMACYWEWEWESEAPLRDVESGAAQERYLDAWSSMDDPRSF
jgi:hypothetical protein